MEIDYELIKIDSPIVKTINSIIYSFILRTIEVLSTKDDNDEINETLDEYIEKVENKNINEKILEEKRSKEKDERILKRREVKFIEKYRSLDETRLSPLIKYILSEIQKDKQKELDVQIPVEKYELEYKLTGDIIYVSVFILSSLISEAMLSGIDNPNIFTTSLVNSTIFDNMGISPYVYCLVDRMSEYYKVMNIDYDWRFHLQKKLYKLNNYNQSIKQKIKTKKEHNDKVDEKETEKIKSETETKNNIEEHKHTLKVINLNPEILDIVIDNFIDFLKIIAWNFGTTLYESTIEDPKLLQFMKSKKSTKISFEMVIPELKKQLIFLNDLIINGKVWIKIGDYILDKRTKTKKKLETNNEETNKENNKVIETEKNKKHRIKK